MLRDLGLSSCHPKTATTHESCQHLRAHTTTRHPPFQESGPSPDFGLLRAASVPRLCSSGNESTHKVTEQRSVMGQAAVPSQPGELVRRKPAWKRDPENAGSKEQGRERPQKEQVPGAVGQPGKVCHSNPGTRAVVRSSVRSPRKAGISLQRSIASPGHGHSPGAEQGITATIILLSPISRRRSLLGRHRTSGWQEPHRPHLPTPSPVGLFPTCCAPSHCPGTPESGLRVPPHPDRTHALSVVMHRYTRRGEQVASP